MTTGDIIALACSCVQRRPRAVTRWWWRGDGAMSDTPLMTLTFTLPYPPSVNTYWRHMVLGGKFKKAQARVYLSEQGERYRTHAILSMNVQRVPRHALKGRLAVHVIAYPPDRRARDLDNLPKGVLDALKHANVIVDDSYIDDLHIVRGPVRPEGLLEMRVSEITQPRSRTSRNRSS
jgi:crossover junction endodeoxyribonuclease RusA